MARIWQEGFENGLPHGHYLEGSPNTQFFNNVSLDAFPRYIKLASGRNAYSNYSLEVSSSTNIVNKSIYHTFDKGELYLRAYVKTTRTHSVTALIITGHIVALISGVTSMLGIHQTSTSSATGFTVYSYYGGVYNEAGTFELPLDTWTKVDMYYKVDASVGAYEVRINNVLIASGSSLNTGSSNITRAHFGFYRGGTTGNAMIDLSFDDIAINDTTGAVNNSWCGGGTIVALKPKGAGNYSQFDKSQGYTTAEADTNTETLKITGHGLSSNDVIYNVTRDAYRVVTVSDVNTLTMTAITGQVAGDIIVAFIYEDTITAGSGTTSAMVVIAGHNLESYEVFVNTTRSNSIRRVIYVAGNNCFNGYSFNTDYTGDTVTSQALGNQIKTFKVKQYAITNHYEAVSNAIPNPNYSNIESETVDQIDTFDIEELVADKGVLTNAEIIAVSTHIYAKEMGAGSQLKPVLRIGVTDYEGDTISMQGGTLEYQSVYDVSPDTSSAWDIAEIDSLEAGVKLV